MSAAAGVRPAHSTPVTTSGGRQSEFLSAQTLTVQAVKVCGDWGWDLSVSRIGRLVRRFLREDRPRSEFTTWFIAYADPTGEQAVHNVLRGQR